MMGVIGVLFDEARPPKSLWTVDKIPDLSGKVVIVTGGNGGVGSETVKALLTHNAKVYLAARSFDKASLAIDEISEATGRKPIFLKLDLANLKSIKESANEFLSKETQLHILFNNAGVMTPPFEDLTADGYDLQFGTNVLGHHYFTKLLMPTLLDTAKNSPKGTVRIVITSSIVHILGSDLNFEAFRDGPARKKAGVQNLYVQSKFANVIQAQELARRYGDQGIVTMSLNPGGVRTGLQRHLVGMQKWLVNSMLYPAPMGALTQLWGGTSPEGAELNGKYLKPWARIGKPVKSTEDPELGKKLWTWLEEQVANI